MNASNPIDPRHAGYAGLAPGTRLNGIYEIERMIGAGGMGEVYMGRELQTGAPVAIKMLLPDVADNEAALALFRREAAALHNLTHDAIVRYFLFTVEPALLRPYLAMEFVEGRVLSDVLAEGPLTFEALMKLMRRVASGLAAAHERGIIHRDVSPDNIILPFGDVTRAKIIDFGIARSTQLGDKTIIGSGFAGKENYVSPEQVGLFGGEVTAKSDIYSLGLVLFQALTGRKLDMAGSQYQLVEKRRRVPDLGGIDLRIRPLLERMLQPDPADRPATMAEIAGWQPGGAAPSVTNASTLSAAIAANRDGRGRTRWLFATAAALVFVAGAGTYAFYSGRFGEPASAPPPAVHLGPQTRPARIEAAGPETRPQAPAPATVSPATVSPAALSPDAAPAEPASKVDRIRRFVEQYNGGDCFFLLPVAISANAAVVEGFGASSAAFDSFGRAFGRDLGFAAAVGVREVSPAQCPAIRFLSQLGADPARAPRINVDAVEVRSGDVLNGSIDNVANRVVELLLVGADGTVRNLSYLLKPGTDSLSFAIPVQRGEDKAGPQLLMAVATPRVLDSLRQPRPTAADVFFLQAVSEAQRRNLAITTAARYIRLMQ